MDDLGGWLVVDGYEDEPAAFGVQNYLGFIRYIRSLGGRIEYTYMTVDQWRMAETKLENPDGRNFIRERMKTWMEQLVLAGAVVLVNTSENQLV